MMTAGVMTETIPTERPDETKSEDPVLLAALRTVQSGELEAFDIVMRRTERRVAGLAWRILGDAEEVRDAVQETFLRAYRFLDRYDPDREFLPWIFRITVNVCRDLDRARRKRTDRFLELEDLHAAPRKERPDEIARRNEEIEMLTLAIDSLPPKERLAIILRDVEGFDTREVARILGSRPATVRVQISSARKRLRGILLESRGGSS